MAKIVQIAFLFTILLAIASQCTALRCYVCADKDCKENFENKGQDCGSNLIGQATQFLGNKAVCVKIGHGESFSFVRS